jgi:hypothetical protein
MARDTVSKKEKLYEPSIAGEIAGLLRRERIVSIRQHTSAYVSIRQAEEGEEGVRLRKGELQRFRQ